ncbi:hypothetical protein M7I_3711 [Glarea lozoyensis 74030]|uniref:Uncharacterized protein n=1 Tax=Glarea lozoyensis (strain ATCC 74030 / MF5533) TaxID=1104152 RepID=H0EM81_GLAL7|nr:hypothetical protein M7I_3711 [Glarea lozoyensis 74030]
MFRFSGITAFGQRFFDTVYLVSRKLDLREGRRACSYQ